MATRDELLNHLWKEVIDSAAREDAIDNIIANDKLSPHGPFGDVGPAIERLLAAGAARRDLRLIFRSIAYEAVFGTLYAFSDPGLDESENGDGLFEDLLTADPTGMEGRPGSIDAI